MKAFYSKIRFNVLLLVLLVFVGQSTMAQVDNSGCVVAGFGVDAGLYSGIIEFGAGTPTVGSNDWFLGPSGRGVIDQANPSEIQTLLQTQFNPLYERRMNGELSSRVDVVTVGNVIKKSRILIDGVWARDRFGGTGGLDQSSFVNASKNGEDPAIWAPGTANVLGKNDLIDVAGHMFRNLDVDANKNDLWFVGLINRAEPGGSAYMDFEFFVEDVRYTNGKFTSGGPQLGHTAFTFNSSGNISKIGDLILNVSLTNGGVDAGVQTRIWVSRSDYLNVTPATFDWGPHFDGAFTGSPFGYASIVPKEPGLICGYVNTEGQKPAAPPWGTKGTKTNTYGTNYIDFSVAEMGINLTALGLDHSSLSGVDPCYFPLNTFIVKTRASDSFTAQLKDFAGPYTWGQPKVRAVVNGDPLLSCLNPFVTIDAIPARTDVEYNWTTLDGNILTGPDSATIRVDRPGTYKLTMTLPTECPVLSNEVTISSDPTKPFFTSAATQSAVACNGNDGAVGLTVVGGTPTYSYTWTQDGSPIATTTQNLTGLTPGSYVAVITDFWGCTYTSDTAVVRPKTPVLVSETISSVSCKGGKDGAITISVSGNGPFSYLWSNGQVSQNIMNVSQGTYSVIITDVDGCKTTFSYTVPEPAVLAATISKVDDMDPVEGLANANGSITLTPSGGTPGYSYSWVGPNSFTSTSQNLTGLEYGNYLVTITDSKGCTFVTSAFIYEPEICDDDKDNDGDGLTNCQDPDCKPNPPLSILPGDSAPCIGENVTYTVGQIGSLNYQWTVAANGTLVSGQGTNTITVAWSTTVPGQICVQADNVGCLSVATCFTATPKDIPPTPSTIIKN